MRRSIRPRQRASQHRHMMSPRWPHIGRAPGDAVRISTRASSSNSGAEASEAAIKFCSRAPAGRASSTVSRIPRPRPMGPIAHADEMFAALRPLFARCVRLSPFTSRLTRKACLPPESPPSASSPYMAKAYTCWLRVISRRGAADLCAAATESLSSPIDSDRSWTHGRFLP